jgi:hypothetical protein
MADMNDFLNVIKQAALGAVNASKPTSIFFGIVVNVEPLQINVEQKMTLETPQLILSRNVTDHEVEMTVDHETEPETTHIHAIQDTYSGGGTSSPTQHLHEYKGRKKYLIHNGLLEGDVVILIRMQGGQKFIVVDRLG